MKKFHASKLIISCLLLFSVASPSYARLSCRDLLTQSNSAARARKPPVSQCVGTCYFEAVTGVVESHLSNTLQSPVTISRGHLFADLILHRLDKLKRKGRDGRKPFMSRGGFLDVVSSGSAANQVHFLNKVSLFIRGEKTPADIHKEDLLLRKMFREVSSLIYSEYALWKISHPIVDHVETAESALPTTRILTDTVTGAQFRIEQLSGKMEPLNDKTKLKINAEESFKKFIESISPKVKTRLDELLSTLDSSMYTELKNIDFDLNFNLRPAHRQDQNRPVKNLEARVLKHLESGEELVLTYFHVFRYVTKDSSRPGFLELPTTEAPMTVEYAKKNDKGGPHAVVVTDILRDSRGRPEYLVVRNSWGYGGRSDRGYHYISLKYLQQYNDYHFYWFSLADYSKKALTGE